jgi:hypothetical protein
MRLPLQLMVAAGQTSNGEQVPVAFLVPECRSSGCMIELIFAMGMRSAALDRMSASRCASLSLSVRQVRRAWPTTWCSHTLEVSQSTSQAEQVSRAKSRGILISASTSERVGEAPIGPLPPPQPQYFSCLMTAADDRWKEGTVLDRNLSPSRPAR